MMRRLACLLVVVCALTAPTGLSAQGRDNNLAMGNPSAATSSTSNQYNYLMSKSQFTLSYNNAKRTPNWVSWHLNSSWIGSTDRLDNFRADTTLPSGWYQVGGSSYTNSGFDRGHMCPSADRTGSSTDNGATFLMTNMIPQSPNNNQRAWASLESYCRTRVSGGREMYIICGPYGTGGTGRNGFASKIDSNRITVPSHTWKVIIVLTNGSNDVGRVTNTTRTIAVLMPNDQSVGTDWKPYRKSVREIESLTGYNFFSNVPQAIQDVIEAKVDNQ